MSTPEDADHVLADALELSPSQRARLAARLIASLEEATDEPAWEAAWDEELRRRNQELESGAVRPLTIEEAMAVVRSPGTDEPPR